MNLPKSFTTVTTFSKVLAATLFILFPIAGFSLGLKYQKNLDSLTIDNKREDIPVIQKNIPKPTRVPTSILSPNKLGWYWYKNDTLDYYMDYPNSYIYSNDTESSVRFEKKLNYPHRIDNYIFINKGNSNQFLPGEVDDLKQMVMGETKVVMKKKSLPNQFKTYERLSDTYFGTKKALSFVNKNVWEAGEGAYLYVYIYEGKVDYVFGGLVNESKDLESNISYLELKEIISTLRFLD